MPKLIATKSFKYKTRRLMAGDELETNDLDARIFTRIRKVAEVAPVKVAKPKAEEAAEEAPKPKAAKPGARARKAKAKK